MKGVFLRSKSNSKTPQKSTIPDHPIFKMVEIFDTFLIISYNNFGSQSRDFHSKKFLYKRAIFSSKYPFITKCVSFFQPVNCGNSIYSII